VNAKLAVQYKLLILKTSIISCLIPSVARCQNCCNTYEDVDGIQVDGNRPTNKGNTSITAYDLRLSWQ
jgi:hypothetical protein